MKTVLIIDDNTELVQSYVDGMPNDLFKVETAGNGKDGLNKAMTLKPDIIVLDIMMPEMNGFDVLKELKAMHELTKIPVVVLTNLAEDTEEETAKQMGAAAYLVKNEYDPTELSKKLSSLLSSTSTDAKPKKEK